ncbi:MAG: VgrG-related protein [Solirubrobacteraceae bacterium]|nr:VgrG-related protein [Solirubrobacteraceae bacterium]
MKSADLAAGAKITLDGSDLDPKLASQLVELRVETTTALPDVCALRFTEADPAAGDGLAIIDNAVFKLGAALSVKLATPSGGGSPKPVFDGEITTVEAELGTRPGGEPALELIVTGHDKSHRMHRKTTTRTLRQVTVSDVAKKVAGENGLAVGTIAQLGGGPAEVMHQVGETDWAFLSRLVAGHGGELDVAAGKLHVIDPAKTEKEVAELTWGETLERFRPRVSSVGQVAEITVHGWDAKKKQAIVKTAKAKASTAVEQSGLDSAANGSTVHVVTAPVSTDGDVQAAATAIAGHLGHERVQAEAVAAGDPLLLAGAYVKISGVGKRFGGVHRIVSAVHVYGRRGYTTRLTLGAGGRPLAQALGGGTGAHAAGFAEHLVIGVVSDNKDPDKLGRVKVKYPTLGDSVESDWARVVRGASGKERGGVAIPEVNDEVVLAFEHGDVRRPFVLGALFNGKDTPGADLVKESSSFAARFPRDLDVATKEKIVVESGKDMTVTAKQGPIEITAGKEMKITASKGGPPSAITIETAGQIKVTGKMGVEIAASAPLKITSTAPVTVESNAALQLKGSVVQVQASGVLQLSGATVMLG